LLSSPAQRPEGYSERVSVWDGQIPHLALKDRNMSLQVWSDNETTQDLLGFRVHADLIRSVVTDPNILPIVLGLFGDWGSGKSSIMQMLKADLNDAIYEKTACLYFNGWMFEGYEDAKTALLSSILIQLGEHKRLGPLLKEKVVGLLKRVKWMEGAKLAVKYVGLPLAATAMTGGIAAIPAAAGALLAVAANAATCEKSDNESEKINWAGLIEEAPGQQDFLEVRKFREEFEAMLAETDLSALVILIDDLDRCLPERIIETLEAIKLFVAVPRTAFVIGADPRIVRHAIGVRYAQKQISGEVQSKKDEHYDLVTDYLEKLIQVPYQLPRLSPSEIETYVNLLACQQVLAQPDCDKVLAHWQTYRKKNIYKAYRQGDICEALSAANAMPQALLAQLAWSNSIADVVTDGLKGNPRQVKRMLNAMALRKQLAAVADMKIRDEVLAKLMVLEYADLQLFDDLSQWQAAANGFPERLKLLEEASIKSAKSKPEVTIDVSPNWLKPTIQNWLRMQPRLSEVDLRDYFWLARDRTNSTLSGVTMVAPIVRRLLETLISGNDGEKKAAAKEANSLAEGERRDLLSMLQHQIQRHPEQLPPVDALISLGQTGIQEAFPAVITVLKSCPVNELQAGLALRIKTLPVTGKLKSDAQTLVQKWAADPSTTIGRAAANSLK